MTAHAGLAAGATLVAVAFALCTLERWIDRRRSHDGVWTVALLLFAAGSASLWVGAAVGWTEWSFRSFYLFGAVVNVPVLALGTVYLLADPTVARWSARGVAAFCFFAAGVLVVAPFDAGTLDPNTLPQGSDVFGALPRVLAAVASGGGATVIFVGTVVSLIRRQRPLANVLIAAGTLILSAGGVFNSVMDAMNAFVLSLVIGIAVLFAGFLVASPRRTPLRVVAPLPDELPAENHQRTATSS